MLVLSSIIVCGPLNNVEKTIVVLGDQHHEFFGSGSPKYAVDTLFKCIKVLKKDFSKASKNVWGYLQKYIYLLPLHGENASVDILNTKITNHQSLLNKKKKISCRLKKRNHKNRQKSHREKEKVLMVLKAQKEKKKEL